MTVMTTTDELWTWDSVDLNTYAYNIATIGGSRFDLPPIRGSNMTFAYRYGQRWRRKVADQRVLTLLMWVAGVDPATAGAPGPHGPQQSWADNWNMLRRLFWGDRKRESVLERKWKLTVGGTPTLITGTALAELAPTPLSSALAMTGPARADFAVDFLLADPFFYGDQISTTITSGAGPTVINNPGDTDSYYTGVSLAFSGGSSPVLTNNTPTVPVSCSVTGGGTVTLDVDNFLATGTALGNVGHSGAHSWFGLERGSNSISLTGGGTCVVSFLPAYL